jgi:hypothetical protein
MGQQFSGESDQQPSGGGFSTSDSLQGMPLILAQHLRNMDEGFSVLFSNKTKGRVRTFFEWEKPGLEDVYALDPARSPAT